MYIILHYECIQSVSRKAALVIPLEVAILMILELPEITKQHLGKYTKT